MNDGNANKVVVGFMAILVGGFIVSVASHPSIRSPEAAAKEEASRRYQKFWNPLEPRTVSAWLRPVQPY
jgi:hypothetical protein